MALSRPAALARPDLAGRGLSYAQFKRAVQQPWGIMPAFPQFPDQELADFLEMAVEDLQSALAEIGRSGIAALDEFVGNESSTSVGEMLADPT